MQELLFLDELKSSKNLLAFSYGTDSLALFYMLFENEIDFDMAMVDYNIRKQSKDEVRAAKELAKKYKKTLHLMEVGEKILSDFENTARKIRYDFFESLIFQHGYENLILAHQLNDAFEWFLMRISRGAGLSNLLLQPKVECEFVYLSKLVKYKKLRPMYFIDKSKILSYLSENNLKYFYDISNDDKKYFRNKIRHDFSNAFMSEFSGGVANSFEYLLDDEKKLESGFINYKNIYISKTSDGLDKSIKALGYISSKAQKEEIFKQLFSVCSIVLGGRVGICFFDGFYLAFINQEKKTNFDKHFKEKCRKHKIPYHLRVFLWENDICLDDFLSYFKALV